MGGLLLHLPPPPQAPTARPGTIGYRAPVWPNFEWLDPNTYQGYTHWGIYLPGGFPEPNQLTGGENCVMANFTMSSNSTPTEIGAWGWADVNCESLLVSICEIPRGRS